MCKMRDKAFINNKNKKNITKDAKQHIHFQFNNAKRLVIVSIVGMRRHTHETNAKDYKIMKEIKKSKEHIHLVVVACLYLSDPSSPVFVYIYQKNNWKRFLADFTQ